MNMSLAQREQNRVYGGKTGLRVQVYPNGECTVFKPKTMKVEPMAPEPVLDPWALGPFLLALWGRIPPEVLRGLVPLGLSPHPYFDKGVQAPDGLVCVIPSFKVKRGLKGITPFGARMVRNAAHLIQQVGRGGRVVFATATVPGLPMQDMRVLHENWHKVVELYRLGLRRALQADGLSGESVTVSEIQKERHERTGIPVLHLHTLFVGRRHSAGWAISTEQHDRLWRNAIAAVLHGPIENFPSSCKMERVKYSAEGYIGKYMTKGGKVVGKIVEAGYARWMPKQWWNCSRTLRARIDNQTRRPDELGDWLAQAAKEEGGDVWKWHRVVEIEMGEGEKVAMALYGRLRPGVVAAIQSLYEEPPP